MKIEDHIGLYRQLLTEDSGFNYTTRKADKDQNVILQGGVLSPILFNIYFNNQPIWDGIKFVFCMILLWESIHMQESSGTVFQIYQRHFCSYHSV